MPCINLTSLKKAIASLGRALAITQSKETMLKMEESLAETVRAGVIQNFEVTYELCWKFMKRWLEANLGSTYVDGLPRHELFRLGAEHGLIENTEQWFQFHKLRNETSHTYDVATAEDVFNISGHFYKAALAFLQALEAKP